MRRTGGRAPVRTARMSSYGCGPIARGISMNNCRNIYFPLSAISTPPEA